MGIGAEPAKVHLGGPPAHRKRSIRVIFHNRKGRGGAPIRLLARRVPDPDQKCGSGGAAVGTTSGDPQPSIGARIFISLRVGFHIGEHTQWGADGRMAALRRATIECYHADGGAGNCSPPGGVADKEGGEEGGDREDGEKGYGRESFEGEGKRSDEQWRESFKKGWVLL